MHKTFEKSSLAMTHIWDDMIELHKSQPKKTYKEDLECEMAMVKIPRFMSWLGSTDAYNEPIGSVGNSTINLIVDTSILSFWMAVRCEIDYTLTSSYIMSTELPPSMYILLTLYEAIIAVMTTGSSEGIKVYHGMLRDGTCDKNVLIRPLSVYDPGCVPRGNTIESPCKGFCYFPPGVGQMLLWGHEMGDSSKVSL
ncbi:hypothetical protein Tco_1082118 [Tanacetum coccineum]|uniref:Uncharacterized protein n=1 Tax=Tanacetum coccineum TaxID=301880 RepID=A0ABQ5HZJ0_9ASTR